jgi:hypothetical protein
MAAMVARTRPSPSTALAVWLSTAAPTGSPARLRDPAATATPMLAATAATV